MDSTDLVARFLCAREPRAFLTTRFDTSHPHMLAGYVLACLHAGRYDLIRAASISYPHLREILRLGIARPA